MADDPKPKSRSFASAARMGRQLERYKAKLKAEADARQKAESERDELKKSPAPEDVVKERDALKGQIRSGKHRAAFDAAAKAAKVRPEALDDLWELSKLDTSADEPDAKAIEAAIGDKVKARPYLLDGAGDAVKEAAKAPLNPGPGSQRGARGDVGGMTVSRSQLCDGEWMQKNQDQMQEAIAAGLVTWTD
jgi:hypothetical protein